MNSKQFQYVLTLAHEGSFSKAADELNIRQPSLSQYIKNTEKEVGMELFDRSGGEVRLTDAGRAYIEVGRKILDLEHQLEGTLSDLASCRTGTIRIGIAAHRSAALMPSVVAAFKSLYPGITLKIIERYRADLMEEAEHGEFDLVVTTLPLDEDLFSFETLFTEENVVASREELPSEPGERFPVIPAASLNGLPFVMLNEEHLMQRELNDLIRTHGLRLRKEVECTSLETLVEMAKAGVGAAFIPACLAKDPALRYYSIRETVPKRDIVVMFRKEQYLSKAILDLKQIMHTLLS